MSRYALIQNGKIHEIMEPLAGDDGKEIPISERFPPEFVSQMVLLPATSKAEVGWEYEKGKGFSAPAEIPVAPAVPQSVTMVQARLALLDAGLLDHVATVIAALPETQRKAAQIEWEFRPTVERDSALLEVLAPALGLDAEALDALLVKAAAIQ